jgi:hypothetical protein
MVTGGGVRTTHPGEGGSNESGSRLVLQPRGTRLRAMTTRGRVILRYRPHPHNRTTSRTREGRGPFLKHTGKTRDARDDVTTDLVEYFIIAVPDVESLGGLGPALAKLVKRAAIRILDVVVLVKHDDGTVTLLELDAVDSMTPLRGLGPDVGRMLSDHDIELAALALPPGITGVVIVTEDRWAAPLSTAARRAGGRIIAGDRIPASRVESVLAENTRDRSKGT